ncbi:MAG: DUF6323 family protein [Oscillospiraceae bacterium]
MTFETMLFNSSLMKAQALTEVMNCNPITAEYGLVLSETQAMEIVQTRSEALLANGRIEFGGGVIDKIIKAFCDSAFMSQNSYAETINELVDIFYCYKNETFDKISDDDLIELMCERFNGVCQGSLDLLRDRELEIIARNIRKGYPLNYSGEDYEEQDYYE